MAGQSKMKRSSMKNHLNHVQNKFSILSLLFPALLEFEAALEFSRSRQSVKKIYLTILNPFFRIFFPSFFPFFLGPIYCLTYPHSLKKMMQFIVEEYKLTNCVDIASARVKIKGRLRGHLNAQCAMHHQAVVRIWDSIGWD